MLRDELGAEGDEVAYADMRELGRNPGRIIPAWHDFIAAHPGRRGGIRGIGEPIWAERRPEELVECQLHEALLNLAFADVHSFRLLCPYDLASLPAEVVHEARCSHPAVLDRGCAGASRSYRGGKELLAPFEAPLAVHRGPAEVLAFGTGELADVRAVVQRWAAAARLRADKADDVVLAASEIAANSVRHGGGRGVLRVWTAAEGVVCEFRDGGHLTDPLAGRKRPGWSRPGGWGLWLAHQLCDLVQVRSDRDGTTVRLLMHFR
jgi:anti-sigma regulatory factor (Ser/Thr protein kinase)